MDGLDEGRVVISAHRGEVLHFAEKDSRQINMLEQIPVANVFNFG